MPGRLKPVAGTQDPQALALLRRIWIMLTCIFLIAAIFLLQAARDFVLPVVLGLLIAITFRPLVRAMAKRGLPPALGAGAVAVAMGLSAGLAGFLFGGPLASWISDATHLQADFADKVRGLLRPMKALAEMTQSIKEAASPNSAEAVQKVVVAPQPMDGLISAAFYPAHYALIIAAALILALFLMASGNMFYEKLMRVMPTMEDKKNALHLVHDIEREVSDYLLSLTAINAGVGVVVGLLFLSIGMPHAPVWALLAFALNFIPYAGPLTGIVLALVSAIVTFDSAAYALLAPLAYWGTVSVENQLVSPYVLSRRLEINAVAILVAVAFFAWLWGIGGIVVSVPLLVTLRVFSLHFASLQVMGEFLAAGKNGSPPKGNDVAARTQGQLAR